jgi:hypothetical protein
MLKDLLKEHSTQMNFTSKKGISGANKPTLLPKFGVPDTKG